jgi:hypothetical protein
MLFHICHNFQESFVSVPPAIVPLQFDDEVAARLAAALDDLVDELARLARATELHAQTAGHDWAGYSRTWFDRQVHQLLTDQRLAARVGRNDLDAVRRARAWAVAEHDRRVAEAAAAAAAEAEAAEAAAGGS